MYGLLFASLLPRDAGCDSMEDDGWTARQCPKRASKAIRTSDFLSFPNLAANVGKRWKIVKKMINGVKNLIK